MKNRYLFKLIPCLIFTLSLFAACNRYSGKYLGLGDFYLFDEQNTIYKIKSTPEGELVGNNIYLHIPDTIMVNNMKGILSYKILIGNEGKPEKIELYSAHLQDALTSREASYYSIYSDKNYKKNLAEELLPYVQYCEKLIPAFSYYLIGKPINENWVYCNFYLK